MAGLNKVRTPEEHRKFLGEYCRLETAVGGPDPHVGMAAWIAGHDPRVVDPLWWFGCYTAPYVIATGEAILQRWRSASQVLADEAGFRKWVAEKYPKFEIRRERRNIYGAERFAKHLIGHAAWCVQGIDEADSFEAYWKQVARVPNNGRYVSIKLYEVLHRIGTIPYPMQDIRPAGAWSPRITLGWLRPEHEELMNRGGDGRKALERINEIAAEEKYAIEREQSIQLTWFEFAVMLCQYRQSVEGRQYPGRTHDTEMERIRKVEAAFEGLTLTCWPARKSLFPEVSLGELGNRWAGRREELGTTTHDYGYTWSDLTYDYLKTKEFRNPVKRI